MLLIPRLSMRNICMLCQYNHIYKFISLWPSKSPLFKFIDSVDGHFFNREEGTHPLTSLLLGVRQGFFFFGHAAEFSAGEPPFSVLFFFCSKFFTPYHSDSPKSKFYHHEIRQGKQIASHYLGIFLTALTGLI